MDAHAYKAQAAREVIEIVDEDNRPLAPSTRAEMRKHRLIHRATYGFVKTSTNYFYVQKRSMLKDYCPGYFDPTPGGVVAHGESYEETNSREIMEEMGISGAEQTHLFTFYYEDDRVRCWGDAWECVHDGPIRLQPEEVDDVVMMSMKEILSQADAGIQPFTMDSIHACRQYVKINGCPVPIGEKPTVKTY